MDAWNAEDGVAHRHKQQVEQVRSGEKTRTTPPVVDMLVRSNHGRSPGLLLNRNIAQCQSVGRSKAILDVACLGFLLHGFHAMLPALQAIALPSSMEDLVLSLLPAVGTAMVLSIDTWSYYAIVAAILTALTNHVLFRGTICSLCNNIGNAVKSDTLYCQLYMRLVQATPVEKVTQERLQVAAESQVIGAVHVARLKYFVDLVLATLVVMTVSILRPIAGALIGGVAEIVALNDWTVWPLPWSSLLENVLAILRPVGETMKDLVINEVHIIVDHPVNVAFQAATFGALVLMTVLPSIEQKRIVTQANHDHDEDGDESAPFSFGTVKTLSNLGVSSASRLGLLSKSGALEGTLERWRKSIPKPMTSISYSSISTVFRIFSYAIASGAIVVAPIMVYAFAGPATPSILSLATAIMRWDSLLDVSILLLFTSGLSWRAISSTVASSTSKPYVSRFVHDLAAAVDEVSSSNRSGMSKLGTSMSPLKGLSVKDLWSAHTAKRAWSVRGANLECPAGQVLVILGDDGSGKTRLLTSVAEAIVFPAKRSLSSTKVRGVVSVGGLDATKWDRSELKKRLGLFLNDVRTISDSAEFMSGFTLEEILEPMDGILSSQSPGTRERSAMNIALEITGLSTSLLPRLPAKLSTVVSANEDELTPSPTRPRCSPLSPSEWSKLLLARVLAQTIYDNDNPSKSGSSENSLIGSLLILDDVTAYMSEVDETRTLVALRRTGAATVLTSHKWATGRFADQIVVIKDGAIVESGTHTDLLSRGPQQSVYAQKWYTMTTSHN
jgi:ABC-type multidrug transport system fused ATPase/permease subunit